jgi:NAD(P)-dependent dehydrogenase (short-subunit alcohol dehydrogenase family)
MSEGNDLDGKVAAITGSSSGWGKAMAIGLAARGVRVVVNSRSEDRVRLVVDEINDSGGNAAGVASSIATMHGARDVIDAAVTHFGGIDILVNNAGVLNTATVLEMTEGQWDDEMAIQLRGSFNCVHLASRVMVQRGRGGRIINMAGGAGVRGFYANANHAASKGGLLAATYTWALELAPYGITVNALRGQVQSETTEPMVASIRAMLAAKGLPVPESDVDLGFYDPTDTVPLVAWLASDASTDITGRFLGIDGNRITIWGLAQSVATLVAVDGWSEELVERHVLPALKASATASTGAGELNPYLALLAKD